MKGREVSPTLRKIKEMTSGTKMVGEMILEEESYIKGVAQTHKIRTKDKELLQQKNYNEEWDFHVSFSTTEEEEAIATSCIEELVEDGLLITIRHKSINYEED